MKNFQTLAENVFKNISLKEYEVSDDDIAESLQTLYAVKCVEFTEFPAYVSKNVLNIDTPAEVENEPYHADIVWEELLQQSHVVGDERDDYQITVFQEGEVNTIKEKYNLLFPEVNVNIIPVYGYPDDGVFYEDFEEAYNAYYEQVREHLLYDWD